MAVDASPSGGAISQQLTQSNVISDASWTKTNITNSAGGTGPDGVANSLTALNETTATGAQFRILKTTGSIASGTRQTAYAIIKPLGTGTRWAVRFRISDQFNNNGQAGVFFMDGTPGYYLIPDTTIGTSSNIGWRRLANGIILLWITTTWVNTGNKVLEIQTCKQDGTASGPIFGVFDGIVTEGFQCYGGQLITGEAPTGWVPTTTVAINQPAETAIFNSLSWFTSGQGTFIVEHDCVSGPLIGSGATSILAATVAGKTAFAWDGSSSDTVNNGGATSSGATPSFGADVRLLGTSAAGNIGHIKSIKFYQRRMSVAEMQAATTAASPASTATPGVLRTASVDNRLPDGTVTTAGTQLNFVSRFRLKMGANAMASLKMDFSSFEFAFATIGNSLVIDACYLERVTTVGESVPVLFSGAASATLADGAINFLSDTILPASFTGLANFPVNTEFWVRVRGHVATAGNKIPCAGRVSTGPSGAVFRMYDPATYTLTNFTGTGPLTFSGSGQTDVTFLGFCPILIGVAVSGDPNNAFVLGDSLVEGVGTNATGFSGTYIRKALEVLQVPSLEFSRGGTSQFVIQPVTHWYPYLAYCRVYIDALGTNDANRLLHFFKLWQTARVTYGYDKIGHVGLFPRSSSTDLWVTEANQTVSSATYPTGDWYNMKTSAVASGVLDFSIVPLTERGINQQKWVVTGASNYATPDGTHQQPVIDNLMATEVQPALAAITVT
jgi:hypothetical protein